MEQKFEKTWSEKFGDFYDKLGNRALFHLGVILLCCLFDFVLLPNVGVGVLPGIASFYGLLSFCCKEKTAYLKTVYVTLPDGKVTPCALFMQKRYAYAPFLLAIFSLGFYIPYKKQYILVRNMGIQNMAPSAKVSTDILASGLLDADVICKRMYGALEKDPQILSDELYSRIKPRREAFWQQTKRFVETGLMEEIYSTDYLSVCRMFEPDTFLLFHYESHENAPCGRFISGELVKTIKDGDSFLLEFHLQTGKTDVVLLGSGVFERWLRLKKEYLKEKTANVEAPEAADPFGAEAGEQAEAERKYLDEAAAAKQVITKELVASRLKHRKGLWKMIFGGFLLNISAGWLVLTLITIVTEQMHSAAFGLPILILPVYFGVKLIKAGCKSNKAFRAGDYRVVKAKCTKVVQRETKDEDGDPCGYEYVHWFSNGDAFANGGRIAAGGDTVYLVYLGDDQKISAFFNGVNYVPAEDLAVEEAL